MNSEALLLIGFSLSVLFLLILDLKVFNKDPHKITLKESLGWSLFWISLALLFNLGIYFFQGPEPALQFFTAYLLEKSLSIDNLFVFLLIFSYFRVPSQYTHQVLFWGICGALVMRAIFILAGVYLIQQFAWLFYIFGAILIISGIKLALEKEKEIHPENNPLIILFKRFFSVTHDYHDGKFIVKKGGKRYATPLFIVLLSIETTDLIFAVDSIPAVLAITLDPFIVYTSNIFAILGLRALYFTLENMMRIFHHLHYGLAVILIFIGSKMILHDYYDISIVFTLVFISFSLFSSIIASILLPKK